MRQQYLKNMIDKPNYTDFKNYKEDKYDVVIIGAGIGGLVCGCYLAKAGLKVLIVEQHYKPGGYCTSFKRKGYTFDVGVHYLGSCREKDGVIYNILQDLLSLVSKTKSLNFDKFLDTFFLNYKLKTILSIPIGNLGIPPSKASALA